MIYLNEKTGRYTDTNELKKKAIFTLVLCVFLRIFEDSSPGSIWWNIFIGISEFGCASYLVYLWFRYAWRNG